MNKAKVGGVYRHFKGNWYVLEAVALDADSLRETAVYRKLYGDGGLWVRPLAEFLSEVDREKYPQVTQTWRFELIEDGLPKGLTLPEGE